jgi:predicted permease
MLQDIRYVVRSLAGRPLVTSVAVLSLALGIGVNTAIFSVFDRLLLRTLPVPSPGEIVHVTSPGPRPGSQSSGDGGGVDHIFSYPLFRDLERLERTGLSRIAAYREFEANLGYGGNTSAADGHLVSGGYFPMLGVRPALGRLFSTDDDRVPGGHPVVVLTHAFWQAHFGGDPDVVGDTIVLNGQAMTIVGVAESGFTGTTTTDVAQLFVPLAMAGEVRGDSNLRGDINQRNVHWLYVSARLEPGITRDQAQSAVNVPFASIIRDVEFPALRSGMGDRARQQFLDRQIVLQDGSRGRDANRSETRIVLSLLLAVTGLVLMIACANVANLMLARAADRSGEIAIRISIGAAPRRVLRLLMTEALALGLLGGATALAVGYAALTALLSTMPVDDAARLPFEVNASVLVFTIALSLLTSVLFGLFPALHSLRTIVAGGVSAQPGRASDPRSATRFRAVLASSQIALATALLAVAGLFITSLFNVGRQELGIRRDGVISFRLAPYLNRYSPERALALIDSIQDELRGVPGVVAVTASTIPVLSNNSSTNNLTVQGFEAGPDTDTTANIARIGTDYFRTLGIPMLAGRDFSPADAAGTPRVAIVNESFARKFKLGTNPIGVRMATGAGNVPLDIEIVGLVRDAKYSDVKEPAPPQFYLPYRQGAFGSLTIYARTSTDARQLRSVITGIVARADPNLPVERLRTMDEQIWDNTTTDRVLATLSSWFAGLATLLAAVGLYAVLAYTVSRRLREIGIRMALGARTADVWRLVFSQVGRIGIIGGTVGIAAALALGRLGQSLLFGVEGANVAVIAAAVGTIALVSVAAAALPARRATLINPVNAIRAE